MDDQQFAPQQPQQSMGQTVMMPMQMPMGFPGQNRSPGRPNADPELQKMRDRQSAAQAAVDEILPKQAKETRFHVYKLARRNGAWMKISARPMAKIYLSDWKEQGLQEPEALRQHLIGQFGIGCYQLTCCDAHGNPMPRVPSWTEDLYQEGDNSMNESQGPRGRGRGRGRFRRGRGASSPRDMDEGFDDEFDDDDDLDDDLYMEPRRGGGGGGIMDFIETTKSGEKAAAAAQIAATQASAQSQNDTMKMILLTSQQQRDADDRRRAEETARQDRVREDRRAEDVRMEERRREERKDDERRREEERRADREREERNAAARQQNMASLLTAAMSVLPGLLAPKKDDTMGVLLAKMVEPKAADPIMMTLITKMLEGSNQKGGIDTMLDGMVKMQAVGTEMQSKQMSSMLQTQQDLQAKMMMQMLASAKSTGDEGWMDKIMKYAGPALPQLLAMAAAQQPAAAANPVAPRPITSTQPAVSAAAPQPIQQAQSSGYDTVARAIIALHQKQYTTETERQQIIDALVANMPNDLKHAIATGDQGQIIGLCTPTFTGSQQYMQWLGLEGAVDFILATAGGLQPMFAQQLGVILEPVPAAVVPEPAAPAPAVAEAVQVHRVPADARAVASTSGTPDAG